MKKCIFIMLVFISKLIQLDFKLYTYILKEKLFFFNKNIILCDLHIFFLSNRFIDECARKKENQPQSQVKEI